MNILTDCFKKKDPLIVHDITDLSYQTDNKNYSFIKKTASLLKGIEAI